MVNDAMPVSAPSVSTEGIEMSEKPRCPFCHAAVEPGGCDRLAAMFLGGALKQEGDTRGNYGAVHAYG